MSTARHRIIPLLLLSALAACQDQLVSPDATPEVPRPQFAQGDGGVWTVNVLTDDGNGTCDDVHCTLREAMGNAASGDRIVFAAGKTGDILLTIGALDLTNKDLEIDGDGRIGVDGQGTYRVFDVDGGGSVTLLTLKGLTIKNGYTDDDGAGIRANNDANLRLERVTVSGSEALNKGGGIWSPGEITIINSTIDNNKGSFQGGGIYGTGHMTVTGSTISRNRTGNRGGGIMAADESVLIIERSTISGNIAGAAEVQDSWGGGIYADRGELQIRSSTITANRSEAFDFAPGGGIAENLANTSIANSIVAGNTGSESPDCALFKGDWVSLGHNVTVTNGAGFACIFSKSTDKQLAAAQIFTEVIEQTLKDNGGPTKTHAIIVRGRAMDAGYCPGETTDQRGLTRPVDVAAITNVADGCDIGAYELQGPVIARTDLMVSQSANKTSVKAGDLLTYTVRVRNLGPEAAPNVVLTNTLSSGVTFVSATHGKGTHTAPPIGETGTVTWTLGTMADQANEFTEIKVTVRIKGKTSITNVAAVTADVIDPNTANNTASLQTTVAAGGKK